MLIQQVLHAMNTEPLPSGAGKQNIIFTALRLTKPGFQHLACRFGQRYTPLLATLADDTHVSASFKDKVLTFKPVISDKRSPVCTAVRINA